MRLTRKVLVLVLIFAAPSPPAGAGAKPSVAAQIEAATKGRDLLLERHYAEVEGYLKSLVERWPDELLGYFGLMAIYQVRNLDNYDFRFDPSYLPWEAKGRPMALKIAKDPEAAPWDMLLAGATLGLSGFYRAHNGKWFPAMRDASLGFHTVQKAYQKDKNLSEALLGVGLYDYWRSHFTRKLLFLPFFADRREEGKEELRRAARESRFASVLAEISLLFIDFQEKRHDRVLAALDGLLRRYPNNVILRFLKGETLLRQKKYPQVVSEFEKILSIDPAVHKSHLYIGLALAGEGKDLERAKTELRTYLDLEPKAHPDWRKPALDKLKTPKSSR